jgi:predicted esterase
MTKEERLRDIDDYCVYLNELAATILEELPSNVKIHVFGFSQGVATTFRWVNNYKGKPLSSLHAWAGTFPPDIDYQLNQDKFNALDISLSFASDDQFISQENATILDEQLKQMDIKATRFNFEGEHKIYAEPLTDLFNRTESKV